MWISEVRDLKIYDITRAQNNRKVKNNLGNKSKDLENDLNNHDKIQKYDKIKSELEEIHEKFVEGAKVRNTCTWYEEGEKFAKLFLNLENKRPLQGQIRKLNIGKQLVMGQNEIQNELQLFYRSLFKYNCTKSYDEYNKFLDKITTQVLSSEKANICEGNLVESKLFKSFSFYARLQIPWKWRALRIFLDCNKRSIDEFY